MGFGYRKSQHREPKNFIHIYSNGVTEINYFNAKKCECQRKRNIKIEPFFENVGSPVYFMKLIAKRYNAKNITEKDKIYCVIDVDEITDDQIQKAIQIKEKYIDLILSNPNFELWLLLHFKLYTHKFSIDETLIKLKSFLSNYEKPHIDPIFSILQENEYKALKNSKQIRQKHNRECIGLYTCDANPHTMIDTVVEEINSFQ
jgi:hypothetical protein